MATGPELQQHLEEVARTLARRFAGVLSPETVDRYVERAAARLAEEARVENYIPVLVERLVREDLDALVRAGGLAPPAISEPA